MKKWRELVLLCGMIAVLVGCSSDGGSNTSGDDGSSSEKDSSNEVVTITEMDYFTTEHQANAMKGIIQEFEKSHPNIKIKRNAVPYTELMPTALRQAQTESLPTILVTDNFNIPTLAEAGGLAPITDFGEIDKSKYLEGPLSTVTYKDKLYGLPLGSNTLAIFYNKTMFEEAGVEPPKTWSDLKSAAKKLSKGSTYGIAFSAPDNQQATWQFSPFMWTSGGSLLDFDSPEAVKALDLWGTLVEEGAASDAVINFSQTDVYNEFAAGRAAMMVMGPWMISPLEKTDIEYGIIPIPTVEAGEKAVTPVGGEAFTITNHSTPEQQKAAFTFIKWLQDKERLSSFNKKLSYIPAYKPATEAFIANNPEYDIWAKQLKSSRALWGKTGANFPAVSESVSSAIQSVLTGNATPEEAAKKVQSEIESVTGE